jgi:hypothetical protein
MYTNTQGSVLYTKAVPVLTNLEQPEARVARWFLFKTKIPIWVNFGGPKIGKC